VQAAVAALPDQHRLVVELRFFASASLDKIATLVGCPLGAVKSRLHHALEKLRRGKGFVNLSPAADGLRCPSLRARGRSHLRWLRRSRHRC